MLILDSTPTNTLRIVGNKNNKNLIIVSILIVVITLLFNRPWSFSLRANANTMYEPDSVNVLVYVYRIVPLLIILLILFIVDLKRRFLAFKSFFYNLHLFSALLFGIVSAVSGFRVYSDYFSVWKSIEFLILLYFFAYVFSCKFNFTDSRRIFNITINTYIVYLVASGVLAFVFPEISFRAKTIQFFSIFPMINPNVMGNLALIVLSYVLLSNKKTSFLNLILASYLFLIFVLSISRTAYIAFIVIIVLLCMKYVIQISFFRKAKRYLVFVSGAFIIFSIFIIPLFGNSILDLASRGQSSDSIKNLSSRTLIWKASRLSIREKPLLGYGLYAETRRLNKNHPLVFEDGKIKKKGISNAHGAVYEILLAAGFLGAGLYLLLFIFNIIRSLWYLLLSKPYKKSQFQLLLCLILIIIFFRFTTGSAISGFGIFTLFYFLIISLRLFPWSLNPKGLKNVNS